MISYHDAARRIFQKVEVVTGIARSYNGIMANVEALAKIIYGVRFALDSGRMSSKLP